MWCLTFTETIGLIRGGEGDYVPFAELMEMTDMCL